MTNHFHLVLETPDANLSRGMRQLNGVYTQQFNRRHALGGHLFQGRFKAILVERETYLLELARYVVLNPVRTGMVARPDDWPWSSYRAMVGTASTPEWLETDWLLGHFSEERAQAQAGYAAFVVEGIGRPSIWEGLRHQNLLGSERFVEQLFAAVKLEDGLREVPRAQRRVCAKPLAEFAAAYPLRREAMARAFLTGSYTMREIAEYFGVHYATVSRAVSGLDGGGNAA